MKIVGINHSHDTSVAVVVDGQVQSVFEEEVEDINISFSDDCTKTWDYSVLNITVLT